MPAEGSKPSIAGQKEQENPGAKEVGKIPPRKNIQVGRPKKVVLGSMQSKLGSRNRARGYRAKVAAGCGPGTGSYGGTGSTGGFTGCGTGGFGGGGGGGLFGGGGGGGFQVGSVASASSGNFYSPELSTDFLELPQSLDEQRNFFRFFYRTEPFVAQALDQHVELPLSKVRLAKPKAKNKKLAAAAHRFCEKWVKRVHLLDRLIEILHEFYVIGEVFIFCEDTNPEMPRELRETLIREVLPNGELQERWEEREDADDREVEWLRKNYKGWTKIRILPPEQVHIETFPFTDAAILELIPDAKTRNLIEMAQQGDANAQRVVDSIDPAIISAISQGENIPLNTDPDAGSFCHYLANKKSQYEPRGHSLLERCIRTIVYWDKLRQAQTSIASRHMTPIRLVYAEDMDEADTEALRDQIDLALMDPDYSIVTNFQVVWEEFNVQGRLNSDIQSEYDLISRQLYAGLGVTEALLTGEASYSGDRISLEVINTRYMLVRERVRALVEENFFKPMCRRMGFVEEDEDGELQVIYPFLSFTRLALRDNQDTFDALFQLYQKGSLDIETIFDLLNIDPETVRERLEKAVGTIEDSQFNEVLRGIYSEIGRKIAENSNAAEKASEYLGYDYEEPAEEEGGRF